jgi:hypothetical protein
MKSAYELAMERLEKNSPSSQLTAAQKSQIAEIESMARAKIAEKDLFMREQITKAVASGDYQSAQQIEQQLAREMRAIQADAEDRKDAVRKVS